MPSTTAPLDPSFFKVNGPAAPSDGGAAHGAPTPSTTIRVEIRALEGMQKEAIVSQIEPAGSTWRMVSDEGPYLNGTDLAPFPLAFFTAGQQFCLMSHLLRLAHARGFTLDSLDVAHDNRYTMSGSILRGDMTGGALPAESLVNVTSAASAEEIARLVRDAVTASDGQAVMRDVLSNRFSLASSDRDLAVDGVAQSPTRANDPIATFDAIAPDDPESFRAAIMTKTGVVERQHGVKGGVGSSLKSEQNRTLHVRGDARVLEGTVLETTIRLFQPLGSSFRMICDLPSGQGGTDSAPPPLAYLSAGVGFCFMTQLGRYAHIKKQRFDGVRICQNSVFRSGDAGATADPVDTHVFVEGNESDDAAQVLVRMGEQTCFLHAAMRESHPSVITAELNGEPLSLRP